MALDFSFKSQFPIAQYVQVMQQKAMAEQQQKNQEVKMRQQRFNNLLNSLAQAAQIGSQVNQMRSQKIAQDEAARQMAGRQEMVNIMKEPDQNAPVSSMVPATFGQTARFNPNTNSIVPNTLQDQLKRMQAAALTQPDISEVMAKNVLYPNKSRDSKMFINEAGQAVNISPDNNGVYNIPPGFKEPGVMKAELWTKPREQANKIREEQFNESQWNKLGKSINSLQSGSRSAVGMAAVGNQRAARALQLLNDPNMTPQLLDYVNTDLGGIMQGGAPHVEQLNRSDMGRNLVTKWANLKQMILSKPESINLPETRELLKNTIMGIMQVDNEVLDTNLGIEKEAYLRAIQSDPKRFDRMIGAANKIKVIGTNKNLDKFVE